MGRPLRAALAAWCVAGAAPERVAYAPNASALAAALQGNGTVRVVLTGDVGCFEETLVVRDGQNVTIDGGGRLLGGAGACCGNATADASCADDDDCLGAEPGFFPWHTCAGNSEWCGDGDYGDSMDACCPATCGACGALDGCDDPLRLFSVVGGALALRDLNVTGKQTTPVVVSGRGAALLDNVDASGNPTAGEGGVARASGASRVELRGGRFANNEASMGGVLALYDAATARFDGATLDGNEAAFKGGVAYVDGGALTWSGSNASRNAERTGDSGGAIYIVSGNVEVTGHSVLDGMDAAIRMAGGALAFTADASGAAPVVTRCGPEAPIRCNHDSAVAIDAGAFVNNRVTDYGGVAFVEDCDFTVRGGTFRGNYAADSSGVLHSMLWSTVTIAGGVFADNRAAVLGGVLTTRRGGAVTITGGTFENNSAASGGVAMIYEGTLDVSGGIFRGNSATFGGAINVQDAVAVTGGVFERNYGHFGGVFFTADYIEFYETESIYASLDWAGGAFRNNSGFFGGVLYAAATAQTAYALQDGDGNAATIGGVVYCATDCVLRGPATLSRSVAADGGAIALGGGVAATVANVTFDANAAARGGDVFLRADAVATLDGVASSGARARVSAGFAWVGGRSVLRLYNATVADARAQLRGGCLALDVSAEIDVSDSTLSGCLALEGGAVYAVGARALAVARVTFAGVVGSIGAVVYASTLEGSASLVDVVVTGARAVGGVMLFDDAAATLRRVSFEGNMGSALSLANGAVVEAVEVSLANGTNPPSTLVVDRPFSAVFKFPAILIEGSVLSLANSSVETHRNTHGDGGAFAVALGGRVDSRGGNVIAGNEAAGSGGAFFVTTGSSAALRPSDAVVGNVAGGGGGAAFVDATTLAAVDGVGAAALSGNSAAYGADFATAVDRIAVDHAGTEASGQGFANAVTCRALDYFGTPVAAVDDALAVELAVAANQSAVLGGRSVAAFYAYRGVATAMWDGATSLLDMPGASVKFDVVLSAAAVAAAGDAFNKSRTDDYEAALTINVTACVPGQILDVFGDAGTCEDCAAGAYWYDASGDAWTEAGACRNCKRGMVCDVGALPLPDVPTEAGHYRPAPRSRRTYECRTGRHGCHHSSNRTGEARCADGYESILCGACSRGRYEVLRSDARASASRGSDDVGGDADET